MIEKLIEILTLVCFIIYSIVCVLFVIFMRNVILTKYGI